MLSQRSALSEDSGKEWLDAGLSQISAKTAQPIAPQNPENTRATPPESVDVGSTQLNEPSTCINPALPQNTNDVDMGDATQELLVGVDAVTGGIALQKARSEADVEMIDGTNAITERGGMEKRRAEEGVEKTVDVREVPAVPMGLAVEDNKATTQTVPDGFDVEMTDTEAGVTAIREGEPAASASGSKEQKGALVEDQTALKRDETLDAPVEPSMGDFKAPVRVLPGYTATEMKDGHAAEASAAVTGKGEDVASVPELKAQEDASVGDQTVSKGKSETQDAPVGPSMGDLKAPRQTLPAYTDVEMLDGAAEASATATGEGETGISMSESKEKGKAVVEIQTILLKEQEAPVVLAGGEHKAAPQIQPGKKEIGEPVVGVDVTGHDSVLYSMDPEEEGGGSLLEQAKGVCFYSRLNKA